jgi:hypothetical protein
MKVYCVLITLTCALECLCHRLDGNGLRCIFLATEQHVSPGDPNCVNATLDLQVASLNSCHTRCSISQKEAVWRMLRAAAAKSALWRLQCTWSALCPTDGQMQSVCIAPSCPVVSCWQIKARGKRGGANFLIISIWDSLRHRGWVIHRRRVKKEARILKNWKGR